MLGTLTSVSAPPSIKLRNLEPAPGDGYTIRSNADGKAFWITNVAGDINVILTPIAYVPTTSGNISNTNNVVTDPNGDVWIIDTGGDAVKVSGSTSGGGLPSYSTSTLTASGETSMRIRYSGGTPPVLTKTSAGEYLLTMQSGVVPLSFVWKESGATFTGGSVKLTIRDSDGESLYANYSALGSTTGDEVGQLSGVVIRQTEPQAGDVQVTFPNMQSISGDFIIIGKPF